MYQVGDLVELFCSQYIIDKYKIVYNSDMVKFLEYFGENSTNVVVTVTEVIKTKRGKYRYQFNGMPWYFIDGVIKGIKQSNYVTTPIVEFNK